MGFLPGCEKNYGINTMEKHRIWGAVPLPAPGMKGSERRSQGKGFTDLPPHRLSGISKISSQPTSAKAEVQKEGKGVFQRNGGFEDPLPAVRHPALTGFPVLFLPCSLSTSHPQVCDRGLAAPDNYEELGKF